MSLPQLDLFNSVPAVALPEGLRYRPDLITRAEEQRLVAALAPLPFKEFEFHGHLGKRRVVAFGWRYDYGRREVGLSEPIPDFLPPLRAQAADFAGLPADELRQVLVTEYTPGAGTGRCSARCWGYRCCRPAPCGSGGRSGAAGSAGR